MSKHTNAISSATIAVLLLIATGCSSPAPAAPATLAAAPTTVPAAAASATVAPTAPTIAQATEPPAPTNASTVAAPTTLPQPTGTPGMNKTRVEFKSGSLTLVGYLYKPAGQGPFPGIIWNHGSEKNPGTGPEFDSVASIFVPAGYVVFAPIRRGQGDSQGDYIGDQIDQTQKSQGAEAANNLLVQLMEGPQLDDQLAGQAYLKSLPYVDQNRLAVAGCS